MGSHKAAKWCDRGFAAAFLVTKTHIEMPFSYLLDSLRETVRKASRAGQSPRHQTTHRHIDERLAGLRQPLVVFAHPPVLIRPRKRAFHHPPPRQHLEAFSWQELLPIDLYSLFGPLLRPRLQDLFWGGLLRTLDELHTPP